MASAITLSNGLWSTTQRTKGNTVSAKRESLPTPSKAFKPSINNCGAVLRHTPQRLRYRSRTSISEQGSTWHHRSGGMVCAAQGSNGSSSPPPPAAAGSAVEQVRDSLRTIIDPDLGMDIVSCGFVKDLQVDTETGQVSVTLELTTPACPVKDEFQTKAEENIQSLPWVEEVQVNMTAQPAGGDQSLPPGLKGVSHIIAVSSCKGGVGKSTCSVNLAYTLAMMGAKVGIFDADIYGPSLPTMITPEVNVLEMDAETKMITPVEYEGVKGVSFGYAGQGSAIMRGPMVSGLIEQMLLTSDWGDLDYLILDMPPGTGDIQLTLCQSVPISAAVIVTTPQKLAFIDVAKGIRMFAMLKVPSVAVVENMSYFEVDGTKHFPFGTGSGQRITDSYGIPNLVQMPITPELSAAGDGGRPLVIQDPTGDVAQRYSELGVAVVQEVSKLRQARSDSVVYDEAYKCIIVRSPDSPDEPFYLHPATVRRNDQSATSKDEWTGEQLLRPESIPEDIEPSSISPVGNYAVRISWPDGLNQIATFDLLDELERIGDISSRIPTPMLEEDGDGAETSLPQDVAQMSS